MVWVAKHHTEKILNDVDVDWQSLPLSVWTAKGRTKRKGFAPHRTDRVHITPSSCYGGIRDSISKQSQQARSAADEVHTPQTKRQRRTGSVTVNLDAKGSLGSINLETKGALDSISSPWRAFIGSVRPVVCSRTKAPCVTLYLYNHIVDPNPRLKLTPRRPVIPVENPSGWAA